MIIDLRMEILGIIATSPEGIEQIEGILEYDYDGLVNKAQILAEIEKLLTKKLIYVAHHDEEEDYDWYELTPKGQAVWDAFDWDTYFAETKSLRREDDD